MLLWAEMPLTAADMSVQNHFCMQHTVDKPVRPYLKLVVQTAEHHFSDCDGDVTQSRARNKPVELERVNRALAIRVLAALALADLGFALAVRSFGAGVMSFIDALFAPLDLAQEA